MRKFDYQCPKCICKLGFSHVREIVLSKKHYPYEECGHVRVRSSPIQETKVADRARLNEKRARWVTLSIPSGFCLFESSILKYSGARQIVFIYSRI